VRECFKPLAKHTYSCYDGAFQSEGLYVDIMKDNRISHGKLRGFLTDSVWSIAGLVLMNAILQVVVFPVWNARLGNSRYGDIVFLIAMMNTYAIAMGIGCNYARMSAGATGPTGNYGYNRILWAASFVAVPYGLAVCLLGNIPLSPLEITLYILLVAATMWRYYGDVEYRLSLNYRRYFLYYLFIGLGYVAGVGLFLWTGLWPLALLPGELLGLAYVRLRGTVLRRDAPLDRASMRKVLSPVLLLFSTHLISNAIFNGDRFVLKLLLDSTAVTIYYQASLLGKTVALISAPLNSVLIGYLTRYKGTLSVRHMHVITIGTLAGAAVITAVCTFASHLVIGLLYPHNYLLTKPYFLLGNLAQVLYFTSTILTTLLLRFSKISVQFWLNLIYAVAFVALCVPATHAGGIEGFCIALCVASLIRFGSAIGFGYRSALAQSNRRDELE